MEERAYLIDQGDIHALFHERRRRLINGGNDVDEEEMNIWARRGLGLMQQQNIVQNPEMLEINREIFRELNEGNMNPEEMRDHFQALIRRHHQQRVIERENQQTQQQQPSLAPTLRMPHKLLNHPCFLTVTKEYRFFMMTMMS